MMKKSLMCTVALLALAGCASNNAPTEQASSDQTPAVAGMQLAQVDNIDKTIEVAYTCEALSGVQKIGVMYGVKDNTLVVAQVKVGNELSPGLHRILNDAQGDKQNSYYGNGLTWTTGKATPANAGKTNGHMLTQAKALDANGQPVGAQDVLLKSCRVN